MFPFLDDLFAFDLGLRLTLVSQFLLTYGMWAKIQCQCKAQGTAPAVPWVIGWSAVCICCGYLQGATVALCSLQTSGQEVTTAFTSVLIFCYYEFFISLFYFCIGLRIWLYPCFSCFVFVDIHH